MSDDARSYALIFAEWGDTARALDGLETAMRHYSADLTFVKTGVDSLRKEPRFQAIEGALESPD